MRMDALVRSPLLLAAAFLLIATRHAHAVACAPDVTGSGTATFYDYSPGTGACSFVGDDSDPMVTAISGTDWAGSAMCGRWLRVTGPLGTVDVRVVDLCPGCPVGGLDMNAAAFALIQNPILGTAAVTWKTIPDPTTGNITYQTSASSNPYFLQVQPRHPRDGLQKLEYLGPSGYVTATRESYNYFTIDASLGVPVPLSDPFTVRLTDVNGQQLVESGIPLRTNASHSGSSQFPVCSPLGVPSPGGASGLALRNAAPNPFRETTVFAFVLPADGEATLRVYDASGRRVRTIVASRLPAGTHHASWDGRTDTGRRAAAGLYFCRLQCGGAVEQRMVVRGD